MFPTDAVVLVVLQLAQEQGIGKNKNSVIKGRNKNKIISVLGERDVIRAN